MSASIPTPESHKIRDKERTLATYPDGVLALSICPKCKHDRVQVEVLQWLTTPDAKATYNGADVFVSGDCPDCGMHIKAGVPIAAMDTYAEQFLNAQEVISIRVEKYAKDAIETEIADFHNLLEYGIIMPEDFLDV